MGHGRAAGRGPLHAYMQHVWVLDPGAGLLGFPPHTVRKIVLRPPRCVMMFIRHLTCGEARMRQAAGEETVPRTPKCGRTIEA